MRYRFGSFLLDSAAFELRDERGLRHTEPLVFDLILLLAESSGRVLCRDEIIERVWKGRIVSDATIASCVKAARKALDDTGAAQTVIRTVRGRGLQFLPKVERVAEDVETAAPAAASTEPPPARPATRRPPPALAVLPFDAFSDDRALQGMADGLVENLTTLLTRVPLLALASRSSSFALKGQPATAQEVGRRLGVDFMIEGSLQRANSQIRLNAQLIETGHGFHLWAGQVERAEDGDMEALLIDVITRLEPQVVRAMFNQLRSESGEPTAGQMLLQASSILAIKGWRRDTFEESAAMLRRVIALEPDLALAHALLALTLALGHRVGILDQTDPVVREAVRHSETALELDDMDSNVLGLAGCALADVGQVPRSLPILNKALRLNPYNGQAWAALGAAHAKALDWPPAVEALERGVAICPMDNRLAVWRAILSLCQLNVGEAEKALATAIDGCANDDRNYLPRLALTAIRLAREERAQARVALEECLRVKPDLSVQEIVGLVGPRLAEAVNALRAAG